MKQIVRPIALVTACFGLVWLALVCLALWHFRRGLLLSAVVVVVLLL